MSADGMNVDTGAELRVCASRITIAIKLAKVAYGIRGTVEPIVHDGPRNSRIERD